MSLLFLVRRNLNRRQIKPNIPAKMGMNVAGRRLATFISVSYIMFVPTAIIRREPTQVISVITAVGRYAARKLAKIAMTDS